MMNLRLLSALLSLSILALACEKDEPVDEPEPEVSAPIEITATIAGKAFKADKLNISTAKSNEQYQITGRQDPETITIIFTSEPEVKDYTLTGNWSNDGVSVTWASDGLSSTTNHRIETGTLKVTSYDLKEVICTFSGTAKKVTDPDVSVKIEDGKCKAKFPG